MLDTLPLPFSVGTLYEALFANDDFNQVKGPMNYQYPDIRKIER
jgi:hypothetical protein